MRKLISLEIKKFKLFSYIKGVIYANLGIMAFFTLLFIVDKTEGGNLFSNYTSAFATFGSLLRITFMIFASALIARLIIDEYRSKTIQLMFMYPIKRRQIMVAKLIIVASFTFLTIFLSSILLGGILVLADSVFDLVPTALTLAVLKKSFISMTFSAIATSGISLIPLYFGMLKKSVPATIVSAIVIVSLINNTTEGFNVFSIIAIPISLAVIGCLIAFYAIRNIERADV